MIIFLLYFISHLSISIHSYPHPLPLCKNLALQENGECSQNLCRSPICETCDQANVADCLLCKQDFILSKLSKKNGYCYLDCKNYQLSSMESNTCSEQLKCPDANCRSCSQLDPHECFVCSSNYFIKKKNNKGSCFKCSLGIANCEECSWITYCTKCRLNYLIEIYSEGTRCKRCSELITNCIKCDGAKNCTECQPGYKLTDNKCIKCPLNCLSCENEVSCLPNGCLGGYYIDNGKCLSCIEPNVGTAFCDNCTAAKNCLICDEGFYLEDPSKCELCTKIPKCVRCDGKVCTKCEQKYKLSPDSKTCISCETDPTNFCKDCDGSKCLKCKDNYLSDGLGDCIPNLNVNCQISDGLICTQCLNNYLFTQLGKCGYKPENCKATNGKTCIRCQEDYYLNNGFCTKCDFIDKCIKCDGIDCLACQEGFFRNQTLNKISSCVPCNDRSLGVDKCVLCWTTKSCRKCEDGYFLSSGNLCSTCFSSKNCIVCDGYRCIKCKTGFYLSEGNQCVACSTKDCDVCAYNYLTDKDECAKCRKGLYVNAENTCYDCANHMNGRNCKECTYELINSTFEYKCTKCMNNYGLEITSNKCYLCQITNCSDCFYNENQSMTCRNCLTGFYLKDNKCINCNITDCLSCSFSNNQVLCEKCISTNFFYSSANQCPSCSSISPGCLQCINTPSFKCIACDSNFLLNETLSSCIPCTDLIKGCNKCIIQKNKTICLSCENSFFLRNPNLCSTCLVDNCAICKIKDRGATCSTCSEKFYLSKNKCLSCSSFYDSNCETCSLGTSFKCKTCVKLFFVDPDTSISCLMCSQNCQNCQNSSTCNICQPGYILQKSINSQTCILESQCTTGYNYFDSEKAICLSCEVMFEKCKVCNSRFCLGCKEGGDLRILAPENQKCVIFDQGKMFEVDGGKTGWLPLINKVETKLISNGNNLRVLVLVRQVMRIYGVYFLKNREFDKGSFSFGKVKSKFEGLKMNQEKVITINDFYSTSYFTILTNSSGEATLSLNNLKLSNENYTIILWAWNFGNENVVLNYTSEPYSFDWLQKDNFGRIVKTKLEFEKEVDRNQRKIIGNILYDMLGLSNLNISIFTGDWQRVEKEIELTSPYVYLNDHIETFYVERNYSLSLDDNYKIITKSLNGTYFNEYLIKNNLNFNNRLIQLTFELLNSSSSNKEPILSNKNLLKLIQVNSTSFKLNISFENTNGFMIFGFTEDLFEYEPSWDKFYFGTIQNKTEFTKFERKFAQANENIIWEIGRLSSDKGYAIYFGGMSEERLLYSKKTKIYRLFFKTTKP